MEMLRGRPFNIQAGEGYMEKNIKWFRSSVKKINCFWWLVKKMIHYLAKIYINLIWKQIETIVQSAENIFDLSRSKKAKTNKNSDVKLYPPLDIKWSATYIKLNYYIYNTFRALIILITSKINYYWVFKSNLKHSQYNPLHDYMTVIYQG